MTVYELKRRVSATGSHFFERSSMKFFGDTMANYGVRPVTLKTHSDDMVQCYELYRRRPVKHGLKDSAYFDCETFERRFGSEQPA